MGVVLLNEQMLRVPGYGDPANAKRGSRALQLKS